MIKHSRDIFEFGSSPGGWTQVILNSNKNIKITSIDLLDLKIKHKNIRFFKENFLTFNFDILNEHYDLVLSDIAPNTTGHQSTDHLRISSMLFDIISLLDKLMIEDGVFVAKIWKGNEEKEIIKILKNKFQKVSYFKPNSSRKDSVEIFIIAQAFNK